MIYFLVTIGVFLIMEGVTWLTHKYVMHGFLWSWHRDHHQPDPNAIFQKNDLFFIVFAIPSILSFIVGFSIPKYHVLVYVGLGILMYGIAYFFVHEILIHQRISWFTNTSNKYFRGLRKGHKAHHKHIDKEDGECFGMLWVPKKYFKSLQ